MNVLIDTHTLFWLLTKNKKLSRTAKFSCRNAPQVFIPTIVILELLYLLNKLGQPHDSYSIIKKLKIDTRYTIVTLDLSVVETTLNVATKLEMHDAILVASAQILQVPLVTKDETIQKVYPKTIW